MGKRYYCDYCDRSFKDDFDARKKHVTGTMHIRNRKEHYMLLRDADTILAEESVKEICKRYTKLGTCPFGSSCRFSHYRRIQLSNMQQYIEEEKNKRLLSIESACVVLPPRLGRGVGENTSCTTVGLINDVATGESKFIPNWKAPLGIQNYNLSLSLQPLNFQSFGSIHCEEWG